MSSLEVTTVDVLDSITVNNSVNAASVSATTVDVLDSITVNNSVNAASVSATTVDVLDSITVNNSITAGTISATNFVGVENFPSGGIIIWSGSSASIPSGWYLCDGTNSTPDLRDKFVVGAGSTYAVDDTGGQNAITDVPAHSHNLSGNTGNSGNHTHNGSTSNTGSHAHGIKSDAGSRYNSTSAYGQPKATGGLTFNTNSAGAHAHNFTTAASGDHSHTLSGTAAETGSASVDIRPPYYALCYIMKT